MWLNPQFSADLVTFNKEILHVKFHFVCSGQIWETLSSVPKDELAEQKIQGGGWWGWNDSIEP